METNLAHWTTADLEFTANVYRRNLAAGFRYDHDRRRAEASLQQLTDELHRRRARPAAHHGDPAPGG